jgi:hypothetical protein
MVAVGSVTASDSGSGLASLDVTASSNDPSTLPNDIVITSDGPQRKSIQLAAKRSGGLKEGRIYTLGIVASDSAGNVYRSNRQCTVNHDQSSK